MKLGLGLYKHMLTEANFRFARQTGATHIVAHLVDYFRGGKHSGKDDQPTGTDRGWGLAGDPGKLWTANELFKLRKSIEDCGLKLEAIENFDPAHWHDILLDGPQRDLHIENVKTIIRAVGEAGIPVFGYNFSIAGVAGRVSGPYARGGAISVGMEGPYDVPMTQDMAWNMVVKEKTSDAIIPSVTHEQLWNRLKGFLEEIIPIAEASGVVLAAHPDDPPTPFMRGQPRLVYQPHFYQKLLDLKPSKCNKLEFCIGSLAEMTEGNIYEVVEQYASQNALGYVHFRNVTGKVPNYKETFVDDGDVDMMRILQILKKHQFKGVLIPDHTPQMSCDAPWHAGMAYAMGYMKAAFKALDIGS